MKISANRVADALGHPDRWRVVLLHGPDGGLIRERGAALVKAVIGGTDDPFRLASLGREDLARIPDEFSALALTGGRRVVHVRDAGETALTPLQRALATPGEALLVVEAGELTGRSKLRAAIESLADGAAIGCYREEGPALAATLRTALAGHRVAATDAAIDWLVDRAGADRGMTLGDVEVIALFAGEGGAVDVGDLRQALGDGSDGLIDDAVGAALGGNAVRLDRALAAAFASGVNSVSLLRQALGSLQMAERSTLSGSGWSSGFRGRPAAAGRPWSATALRRGVMLLAAAERACKRTGAPDQLLCKRTMTRLAALARFDQAR